MQRLKNFFSSLLGLPQSETAKNPHARTSDSATGRRGTPPPPVRPNYGQPAVHRHTESELTGLTSRPVWDWSSFRGVLICLASMGVGNYVPAGRRPDSVCLDGLYTTLSDLRRISTERQGRETSRVVFVDRDRSCLVDSGKTHVGTLRCVQNRAEPEPGRGTAQTPVLTIHVHPNLPGAGGLSDQDYVTFLSDPRQIIMMVVHSGGVVLAMKTSATRSEIGGEAALRLVSVIQKDVFRIWNNYHLPDSILALNKAVCMEFGMTLYQAAQPYENIARRIGVTGF